jgi:predicted nucleic acid-binding protein
MIVALDTNIVLRFIAEPMKSRSSKKEEVDRENNLRERARFLLQKLIEARSTIIVPSIAVGEVLAGIDPSRQSAVLEHLSKSFTCSAFDLAAAGFAADLYKRLPSTVSYTGARVVLKADLQIAATAKTAGASHFYSIDPKCRELATALGMMAYDLPEIKRDLLGEPM